MKMLIMIVLFFSCGDRKNTNIPKTDFPEFEVTRGQLSSFNKFTPEIDTFVAFLWPREITSRSQKEALRFVLSLSRSLKKETIKLQGMNVEFDRLRCEEILAGEIDVDIDFEDECYELSDEKDFLTQELFQKVIQIEENVVALGGEWFATPRDFDLLPLSNLSIGTRKLNFTALGSYIEDGENKPIEYKNQEFKLTKKNDYYNLRLKMPRLMWDVEQKQLVERGELDINVSVTELAYSMSYQGEFKWSYLGETRQGVTFWQNELRRE